MRLLVCAATARELAALAPHDLSDVATHLEGHGTCSASSVFNAPAGIFASRAQVHLTLTGVAYSSVLPSNENIESIKTTRNRKFRVYEPSELISIYFRIFRGYASIS